MRGKGNTGMMRIGIGADRGVRGGIETTIPEMIGGAGEGIEVEIGVAGGIDMMTEIVTQIGEAEGMITIGGDDRASHVSSRKLAFGAF